MSRSVLTRFLLLGCVAFIAVPALALAQDFKLKRISVEEEIADATAKANAAIRRCDEEAYEDAIDWLDEIAEEAPLAKARQLDHTIDMLDGKWNATFPCGLAPRENSYAWNFRGAYGALRLQKGPVYLGKENGGFINTLSLVQPDRSDNIYSLSTGFRMSLASMFFNMPNNIRNMPIPRKELSLWDVDFRLSHSRASIDDHFSSIGTGGDTLLLPGVGSGPNGAGFSLPFAGGLNTVQDAIYDSNYSSNRFSLGFGKTMRRNEVKLRPYGGFEYGHLDSSQRFSGSIPGYARDFSYDTKVDVHSYSPFIGLETGYAPSWLKNSKVPIEMYGDVKYKLSYNDADGRDRLAFTGFNTQSIGVDKNKFTHGLSLGAGVRFNLSKQVSAGIGYSYELEGNTPVVSRDGSGPSELSYRRSSAQMLAFDVRVKWGN